MSIVSSYAMRKRDEALDKQLYINSFNQPKLQWYFGYIRAMEDIIKFMNSVAVEESENARSENGSEARKD